MLFCKMPARMSRGKLVVQRVLFTLDVPAQKVSLKLQYFFAKFNKFSFFEILSDLNQAVPNQSPRKRESNAFAGYTTGPSSVFSSMIITMAMSPES